MSEGIESMVSAEYRAEAERMADRLAKMSPEQQRRLEIFLSAIEFWEPRNKPEKSA